MSKKNIILLLIPIFSLGFFCNSYAQLGPNNIPNNKEDIAKQETENLNKILKENQNQQVFFETTPKNFEIGKDIKLEVKTYNFNINNSFITWKEDGKIILSGRGEKFITTKVNSINKLKKFNVEIISPQGLNIEKEYFLKIFDIDIIWQSETISPPFYRARVIPSPGANINLLAITNTSDEQNFSYEWEIDFKKQEKFSGYEKNVAFFKTKENSLENYLIRVNSTEINGLSGKEAIIIPTQNPEILIYENHPLFGINLSKNFKNKIETTKNNISLIALPIGLISEEYKTFWSINQENLQKSTINVKRSSKQQEEILINIRNNKQQIFKKNLLKFK